MFKVCYFIIMKYLGLFTNLIILYSTEIQALVKLGLDEALGEARCCLKTKTKLSQNLEKQAIFIQLNQRFVSSVVIKI